MKEVWDILSDKVKGLVNLMSFGVLVGILDETSRSSTVLCAL